MAEPLVRLEGLCKSYEGVVAVERVDLDIAAGEFVVLLGPSGSGKTTILSMLGGFVSPSEGRILIGGEDVTGLPPAKRPTATVFQDYALFPHMSVRSNVGFGLAMRHVPKAERERTAEEMLRLVGLDGFGGRGIHQLSGGQRQRVALARAMAVTPTVLLLDEPLGALDLSLRRQMQEELVRIQKRLGTTFVHVTHDQEEAMSIADTVVVMNKGRIEDMGPPSRVYLRPASLFAATFMGESNVIAGRVMKAAGGKLVVDTRLGRVLVEGQGAESEAVHLCIRPEQLDLSPDRSGADVALGRARVTERAFQGTHLRLHAVSEVDSTTELLLRLSVDNDVTVGATIDVYARAADVVVLRG
jgi:spermidine/putrescine transport system ATP-binding protein